MHSRELSTAGLRAVQEFYVTQLERMDEAVHNVEDSLYAVCEALRDTHKVNDAKSKTTTKASVHA